MSKKVLKSLLWRLGSRWYIAVPCVSVIWVLRQMIITEIQISIQRSSSWATNSPPPPPLGSPVSMPSSNLTHVPGEQNDLFVDFCHFFLNRKHPNLSQRWVSIGDRRSSFSHFPIWPPETRLENERQ